MSAIAFDTLKFANKLKAAGVPATKEQVQGIKEQVERQGVDLRREIDAVGKDLRKEIDLLRSDMNKEFQIVRQEFLQTKNELLQVIAHNETPRDGQDRLLRWMATASLGLLAGIFIRVVFFGIK